MTIPHQKQGNYPAITIYVHVYSQPSLKYDFKKYASSLKYAFYSGDIFC